MSLISKIRELERDLNVEIVIQEEEGHWGVHYPGSRYGTNDVEEDAWIVDKPRIAEPNIKKRESAKEQLQLVYNRAKLYTARYYAGRVLNIEHKVLEEQIPSWLEDLEKRMSATEIKRRKVCVGSHIESHEVVAKISGEAGWLDSKDYEVGDYADKDFTVFDIETRRTAFRELTALYKMSNSGILRQSLLKIYKKEYPFMSETNEVVDNFGNIHSIGFRKELIRDSGRELGYSPLKIFFHTLLS